MNMRFHARSGSRAVLLASLFTALLFALAGCGADDEGESSAASSSGEDTASPTELTEMTPVKLGITSLGINLFWDLQVADAEGMFEQNNLQVEFVPINTPGDLVSAAAGGSTDFVGVATDTLVNAIDGGAPLKIISAGAYGTYGLVTDKGIQSYDRLKGKKIGIADPASGSTVLLLALLEKNGLSKDDVQLVPAGDTPSRLAALKSGAVDAALLADPATYVALESGDFAILGNTVEAVYPYLITSYAVNTDWAADKQAAVSAFLKAVTEAKTWLYDPANKDRAIEIFAQNNEIDPALAEQSYQAMFVDDETMAPSAEIEEDAMQAVFDAMNETSGETNDRSTADYVDTSYAESIGS